MRILLLTRYGRLGASSRLRTYQYLPYFKTHNIEVTLAPFFDDVYLEGLYSGERSIKKIIKWYFRRLRAMLSANRYDLIWVEKELLPWLPASIELNLLPRKIPMVVDYDDAIFHRYDQQSNTIIRAILGNKIDAVMRRANLVVAGNEYIAQHARNAGASRVEILPTVVDIERYKNLPHKQDSTLTIGWIGSPSTANYLNLVAKALLKTTRNWPVKVVVVGIETNQIGDLPVEAVLWHEETEVAEIQRMDIGIMPLPDKPWEWGKCGYKLIQYMACGKPVVASPIGVNSTIVKHGVNGFLAGNEDEWVEALNTLCGNPVLRQQFGIKGREQVECDYSLQMAAPKLVALLKSVIEI
jgi:glycosyltransferase involved in cell wall biosynthesis